MTSAGYDLTYLVTLLTIVFGALTFSVLAVYYWRERLVRRGQVLGVFTAICAAAFCINLLLRIFPKAESVLGVALDLAAGFIPPVLLHLVMDRGRRRLRLVFYVAGGCAAVLQALDDLDLLSAPFRDQLPAVMLGIAGGLGLLFVRTDRRALQIWYRCLLTLTLTVSAASLLQRSALTVLAPDYLLLAFFCVTLYYKERLIFFDLLIKRGAFFALALAAIVTVLTFVRVPDPVTVALVLAPFWLVAPWADARLARAIDRLFLRRRYSAPEAERIFLNELQLATSEADLRSRSEWRLTEIFQGEGAVGFEHQAAAVPSDTGTLVADLRGGGWASVRPRKSGIPYMTEDRRLFDSLTRTLSVVLENVRFREQQQRQQEQEQHLRLLASRAELKALRAQINPHFLFNALNAIAGLIPSQPELADKTVEELAQVFRYTLRKSENEWVRLDEEVEFITAYLRVEKARFGERLTVEISISPQAAGALVPAMCIQPLVENAVKHGASLMERGGRVTLRGAMDDTMLRLEVTDNGPGFPAGFSLRESSGHGLRNVDDRLRGYYGGSAQLQWHSEPGATRVWMHIPARPLSEPDRR